VEINNEPNILYKEKRKNIGVIKISRLSAQIIILL
jgi:hypothetical protein